MKKIFSIALVILALTSFTSLISAQEEVTQTDTVTTTADDEETAVAEDTTAEDDITVTTTDDDETIGLEDETVTVAEDDNAVDTNTEKAATTEQSSTTGFLDNIDTMWLWVILGIGAVVLIGSLIGIFSLSKKEKKEMVKEDESNKETQQVDNNPVDTNTTREPEESSSYQQPEPQSVTTEIPDQSNTSDIPVQEEPIIPQQEESSIRDTLGDVSSYKQPEQTATIVSNEVPQTDTKKDLEDLNFASPTDNQNILDPQPSTIETATITPEILSQQEMTNTINGSLNELNQQNSQPSPNGMNIANDMQSGNMINGIQQTQPITQGQPVIDNSSIGVTNPPVNDDSIPTTDNSTTIPQNQEVNTVDENLSTEGINQPINTTSL